MGRELLRLRRNRGGATLGALTRCEALRQVLGGGDPRLAYNGLKHVLLMRGDSLGVTALSYSLGYASDAATHLDRLSDFGRDFGYDQRQARRYSDSGVVEVARHIGSEFTLEASPVLELRVLRADEQVLELYLRTERLEFIAMQEPRVEAVTADGERTVLPCDWHESREESCVQTSTNAVVAGPGDSPAVSVFWLGEIWPRFVVEQPGIASLQGLRVQALGTRVQVEVIHQYESSSRPSKWAWRYIGSMRQLRE